MIEHISFDPILTQSNNVELLRATVGRFQRIFSGGGYGFWEWNILTNKVEWSGGFWERLGYDNQDALSIDNPDAVLQKVYPEDRPLLEEAITAHFKSRMPLEVSYRIFTKSGELVWAQTRADTFRTPDDKPWILSGVSFDISDLKTIEDALRESEARQARIVQASSDGIWEWYADHGGFHFSHRCWELLGYTAQDDVLTEGEDRLLLWRKHIYPEDLPKFDEALLRHINGEEMFDVEYRIVCLSGEIRWVRARGKAVFDKDNRPLMMSGSNIDITEVKRAEERVLYAKEQAEKANQAKSDFLSSMSHELRTPLNAILGYAQLFEMDQNLNALQISNLREIRKAGQHLLQLINDVLDLSKIESGNFSVELEPVLLARLVLECCTLMETQASGLGVKISIECGAYAQAYVMADPKRLKQALLNLISNAIKYNRLGGSVKIILCRENEAGLRVIVEDTGRGIPQNKKAQMFEPFNRLAAENTTIEGSGVGLVITKRLVEMMLGDIGFSSVEGVGTVFWIELPRADAIPWQAEPASQKGSEHYYTGGFEIAISRPIHILYVEDNATNIRLMQQIAAKYPLLNLDVAEEPFIGIFKARNNKPDLIILDINLPGMDGFEVLSVLKADKVTKHIPVVALSANAMPYDIERGRQASFYDYLTKPIQLDQFIATINTIFADATEEI